MSFPREDFEKEYVPFVGSTAASYGALSRTKSRFRKVGATGVRRAVLVCGTEPLRLV